MSARTVVLHVGRERPGLDLFWLDDIGDPVDLTGYSCSLTVRQGGTDTSITGATVTPQASPTTDTRASTDVPSLRVTFASGALNNLTTGPATLIVVATQGGLDREGQWLAEVRT
jgi:hypothetical protein